MAASLTILYWRDIPTQVVARAGRANAKAELPRRFMEAVDSAAMRAGLFNSDDYLSHWRRGEPSPCGDDLDKAVADAVALLDAAYDATRLRALIEAGGRGGCVMVNFTAFPCCHPHAPSCRPRASGDLVNDAVEGGPFPPIRLQLHYRVSSVVGGYGVSACAGMTGAGSCVAESGRRHA